MWNSVEFNGKGIDRRQCFAGTHGEQAHSRPLVPHSAQLSSCNIYFVISGPAYIKQLKNNRVSITRDDGHQDASLSYLKPIYQFLLRPPASGKSDDCKQVERAGFASTL
jgi:hypothetical protein